MNVGICDFPSIYAFPPHGYGGIERWLWAVAVGAARSGAAVHLIGPGWRSDLSVDWPRMPLRLEDLTADTPGFARLSALRLDLLVVGHEYPSRPEWRRVADALDCRVVTFQHDPDFQHLPGAFDGDRARLFCYSAEMAARYRSQHPRQTVSVQFGLGEEKPPAAVTGSDLVWLGRLDSQKAPHLAVMAAQRLGRRLHIIGTPIRDTTYAQTHPELHAPHVDLMGELAGAAKTTALADARAFVYTCARDYIEAGAATFGEALRAGTPVAALAWRGDTCAEAALCEYTGRIARVDPSIDDETAADLLAEAIATAEQLDARQVQTVGLHRFDPQRHYRILAGLSS